ncbi:hypothetical protein VTJ04DRAFT_2345 [Mycothermus thermophilus]|uniref:uncharacterized protein n=1 Tax=Humicola insolens TaxID=85995 RepID=UPI00374239B4
MRKQRRDETGQTPVSSESRIRPKLGTELSGAGTGRAQSMGWWCQQWPRDSRRTGTKDHRRSLFRGSR